MGTKLDIKGVQEAIQKFRDAQGRVRHGDAFYQMASLAIYKNVIQHFKDERGPDGPWHPLAASTILRRMRKSVKGASRRTDKQERRALGKGAGSGTVKMLQDTGLLRASILFEGKTDGARVYTETTYAAPLQDGAPSHNLPARPFVWAAEDVLASLKARYPAYIWTGKV